jgi:carbon storage regulator
MTLAIYSVGRKTRQHAAVVWPPQFKRDRKDKELQMLVLSRKVGERIHVGENIVLEIRRIAGNRVTLALDAPRDVRILRGELEQAAKEFRAPEHAETQPPVFENASPANVAILQTLSTDPLGRHCVS